MLLVVSQFSRDVIGYEDSIRLSSQLNSRFLLVKLSVVQSSSRSWFCLSPSISRFFMVSVTVGYDLVAFVLS